MNRFRRAAAAVLALLLCAALLPGVSATETEGTDPAWEPQGTEAPETQPQETEAQETQPPEIQYQPSTDFNVNFREVNETVYSVGSVNIRMGPGTQYRVIAQLNYGYSATRIGVGDNGWSMCLWQDQVVYIFSLYLSTTRPQGYQVRIDDTALMYQIAMANGLTRSDYTRESWAVLADKLMEANEAMNSNSQAAADDAEKALAQAIADLIPMNYTALENILAEVDRLAATDENTQLWYDLVSAAHTGRELLTSGNQAAVDATTEQIRTLILLVQEKLDSLEMPDVVIQEVPMEVPPTDDYCNIPSHRVWPVLFFISLVLNVALVAVIVIYIRNKKKNQQDDTPLVDYDIFDDTF